MSVIIFLCLSIVACLWLCRVYIYRNIFAFSVYLFGFFLLVVFLLDYMDHNVLYDSESARFAAIISVGCFVSLHFFLTLLGVSGPLPVKEMPFPALPTDLSDGEREIVKRIMLITLFISVVSFGAVVSQAGTSINWENLRNIPGYLLAFSTLNIFALMASTIAYVVNSRWYLFGLLFIPLGFTVVTGARIIAGVLAGAVILLVAQLRQLRAGEKLALLVASVPVGLLVHITLRGLRAINLNELGSLPLESLLETLGAAFNDWSGGESTVSRSFTFVFSLDWQELGVEYFQSLIRVLAAPIPSSAWPGKPVDVGTVVWLEYFLSGLMSLDDSAEAISAGDITERFLQQLADPTLSLGTVHPFIWGEAWVQGGFAALVAMPLFYAIVIKLLTVLVNRANRIYRALMIPLLIGLFYYVVRGNVAVAMANMLYVGTYLYLLTRVVLFFSARQLPALQQPGNNRARAPR
jgi:hypothetical protein